MPEWKLLQVHQCLGNKVLLRGLGAFLLCVTATRTRLLLLAEPCQATRCPCLTPFEGYTLAVTSVAPVQPAHVAVPSCIC